MGWKRRYIMSLGSPNKPCTPAPRPGMTTIGGVTHRLRWLDRGAGYRMACACGWADPTRHGARNQAVNSANSHLHALQKAEANQTRAAQRAQRRAQIATWAPEKRRNYRIAQVLGAVVAVALVGLIIGLIVAANVHGKSWEDGYNYEISNNSVLGPPGCSRTNMNTTRFSGDNYSQWRAGCQDAAG